MPIELSIYVLHLEDGVRYCLSDWGESSIILACDLFECYFGRNRSGTRIVAIDLQKMAPIENVAEVQDDITSQSAVDAVLRLFDGKLSDLVVCDGAPDVVGRMDFDEFIQNQLVLAALRISIQILKRDGVLVAKIFRGKEVGLMTRHLKSFFMDVAIAKPCCCRTSSIESFVVCRGFSPICDPENFQSIIDQQVQQYFSEATESDADSVPFVACPAGNARIFDSDMNYPLTVCISRFAANSFLIRIYGPSYRSEMGSMCITSRSRSQLILHTKPPVS